MSIDLRQHNPRVIAQFRAGGPVDGMHRDGLLLLTTVGARTGQQRTVPMMFHRDGDRVLVMASDAGSTKTPDWYHNLVAQPQVRVEIGDTGETYEAVATPLEGEDYERTWAMIKERYPFFGDHERTAGRTIPLVALTPRA